MHIYIRYLIVHSILVPGARPHLLWTCLEKLTCFWWLPSDNRGLMFCEYVVKSSLLFRKRSIVFQEHQLFSAFSREAYDLRALRFMISTNSPFVPFWRLLWSRALFSYPAPKLMSFSFSVIHFLRNHLRLAILRSFEACWLFSIHFLIWLSTKK